MGKGSKGKPKQAKSLAAAQYAELSKLVETSGPFISLPVFQRAFPQGLEEDDPEHVRELRVAWDEWREATARPGSEKLHLAWILFVLRRTLELPDEVLKQAPDLPDGVEAKLAEHGEILRPDFAIVNPAGRDDAETPRLLIQVVRPDQDLEKPLPGRRWKASPATRMCELVRGSEGGALFGLVTNGSRWTLVHAPRGETAGFASWEADLWPEERLTLRAFRAFLGARRFFGVADDETLEALYAASAQDQAEVTDQLGFQVRRSVETLVQAIDRIDRDRKRKLLEGFDERRLYEATVTVMMRLVFLLYAEEQDLLPLADPFYAENYAVSTLQARLQEDADRHGEEILERRHAAWGRLLATFRAVHGGVEHEAMRLPAYGGGLFDPDRFPFLEGRPRDSTWREVPADPLPIDDRTVLHLLTSLQFLALPGNAGKEARRLSFRALGVEQIGHVYESLLDHTAIRASGPVLGLVGSKNLEPEVPLEELEAQRKRGHVHLVGYVHEATGKSEKAVEKALDYEIDGDDHRFVTSCEGDAKLAKRVLPWAGLVREDAGGYPVVYPAGSVYVTQASERRDTGTHYTRPVLTEPIVKHALDPLVYGGPAEGRPEAEWKLRSPGEILALKLCDMAMGSGAFLVQATRYLSERLVESWEAIEAANPGKVVVTPEGDLSNGSATESPLPRDTVERLAFARRAVVDRCIYGVDRDPMAVEMAKLSLWLVTLRRNKPFTFVDHALRTGDSLLGASSRRQLECFDLSRSGGKQIPLFARTLQAALADAAAKRRRLESFGVEDVRDAEEKARLLREADAALKNVRLIGDALVAVAIAAGDSDGSEYAAAIETMARNLSAALGEASAEKREQRLSEVRLETRRLLDQGKPPRAPSRRPFHWPLEFPEVFSDEAPGGAGFDAITSNPPFAGGTMISGREGKDYQEYLKNWLAGGDAAGGRADLCAYFFLRAYSLLSSRGHFGLLATNTIGQGDTREVGLDAMAKDGCTLRRAVSSMVWPGTANLHVSVVWGTRAAWNGAVVLDDATTDSIPTSLQSGSALPGTPSRLASNRGNACEGVKPMGDGFLLTFEEAKRLLKADRRNAEVLHPFLGGTDFTSHPEQAPSRWAINFYDWSASQAKKFPGCWTIVEAKVRPFRQRKDEDGEFVMRRPLPQKYWQYGDSRKSFFKKVSKLKRFIVTPQTRKHHVFAFVDRKVLPQNSIMMIAADDYGTFALLSSSIHRVWIEATCSTLEDRQSYRVSDGFDTFPRPDDLKELADVGQRYDEHRRKTMLDRNEGLTALYNRFDDPSETAKDVVRLRELHVELDRAVLRAYSWTDVEPEHGFHPFRGRQAWVVSDRARRKIVSHLFDLNQRLAGAPPTAKAPSARRAARRPRAGDDRQPDLPLR